MHAVELDVTSSSFMSVVRGARKALVGHSVEASSVANALVNE